MASLRKISTESSSAAQIQAETRHRAIWMRIEAWNRRLHYYCGLLLLPFLMLFTISGLLLNHPTWRFTDYWPKRVETTAERAFQPPAGSTDLERARELMRQFNASGEIEWLVQRQQPGSFDFRIDRPGRTVDVHADLNRRIATIKQIDVNAWGKIRALHEFTGVRATNLDAARDWWLTILWSVAMDVLAAGMIFMTLSSLWMWWRFKRNHRLGFIALSVGAATCLAFAVGIRLLA